MNKLDQHREVLRSFVARAARHDFYGELHEAIASLLKVTDGKAEPVGRVFQTKFGVGENLPAGEQGNCTEASVATYLQIPLADVPCLHGEDGAAGFWDRLDEFFMGRGMYLHRFDGAWIFPCLYLASGTTSRGTHHMVVMKDGELFHDPHPNGNGLTKMDHAFLAVPLNPGSRSVFQPSVQPPVADICAIPEFLRAKPAARLDEAVETVGIKALIDDISAEVARATAKFPTWPTDPLHALAVLGEEYGELTKDMLQLCYEPQKTSRENVRKEAMQTAAMALRLAMSLDAYEYKPGAQHSQDPRSAFDRCYDANAARRGQYE